MIELFTNKGIATTITHNGYSFPIANGEMCHDHKNRVKSKIAGIVAETDYLSAYDTCKWALENQLFDKITPKSV